MADPVERRGRTAREVWRELEEQYPVPEHSGDRVKEWPLSVMMAAGAKLVETVMQTANMTTFAGSAPKRVSKTGLAWEDSEGWDGVEAFYQTYSPTHDRCADACCAPPRSVWGRALRWLPAGHPKRTDAPA